MKNNSILNEFSLLLSIVLSFLLHGSLLFFFLYEQDSVIVEREIKMDQQVQNVEEELEEKEIEIVQAVTVNKSEIEQQVARIQRQQQLNRQKELARQREVEREYQQTQNQVKQLEKTKKAQTKALNKALKETEEAQKLLQEEQEKIKLAEEKKQKSLKELKDTENLRKTTEQQLEQLKIQKQQLNFQEAEKQLLEEQLANEQRNLKIQRLENVLTEVERYQVLIKQAVQRNFNTTPNMKGKSCQVIVNIAKDGFIFDRQVIDGDKVVCDAALIAIDSSGNLPLPEDNEVYLQVKNIEISFEPGKLQ